MLDSNNDRILEQWVDEYSDDPEFIAGELASDVIDEALKLLDESGLNQTWLANKMGVSRNRVSRIFNATPNLTLVSIARIAVALGVKPKVYLDSGAMLPLSLDKPLDYEALKTDYQILANQRLLGTVDQQVLGTTDDTSYIVASGAPSHGTA